MKSRIGILIIILINLISVLVLEGCTENTIDPSDPPVAGYTQVDFEPSWSSDAERIAYVHSDIDNKYTGIYIVNSGGTNERLIVSDFARSPGLSPDDQWIIYSQFNNIYKLKTDGDSLTQLTADGKNLYPKCSIDSGLIAYSNSMNSIDYSIMLMNSDGTQKRVIDGNGNYPAWMSGSSSLIYFKPVKNNNGSQSGDTLVRYFLLNNTKQAITVLNGSEHLVNMYPVFTGDGFVFSSADSTGSVYIYSMDTDGNNILKLTSGQGYSPDFSFANKKIVYTNRSLGNGRIWVMDKNGGNKMQVTF